ncbi:MAG TPA: hypothetical protein VD833_01245 [Vicinamibacterales bacterium]|nr:hypothetical protein [Vicinamibacterales bacterium]
MLKYTGGTKTKAGFYWNLKEWEAHIVPPEGGPLPGTDETRYVRLPLLAVLMLAPVMGAIYAFFLPFIGFAMVVGYLAGRVRRPVTTTPPAAEQAEEPPLRKAA